MDMKRYALPVAISLAILAAIWGLGFLFSRTATSDHRLHVVATFFPLASLSQEIGGDSLRVTQIIPDGVEVHDYDPSAQDIAELLSADVVVMNGGGVDDWAEEVILQERSENLPVIVRFDEIVPFLKISESEEDTHGEHNDEHEGGLDPHAWLDPARMESLVREMGEAFIGQDIDNGSVYADGVLRAVQELRAFDVRMTEALEQCPHRSVFVTHDAFSYWGLRYGIDFHGISGLSPEAEPSLATLADLREEMVHTHATTVFFESPASEALAQTLASEVGISAQQLSPLEGRLAGEQDATYLELLEKNRQALLSGISCTP